MSNKNPCALHNDVIICKHFPRYWPFVRRIHRWLPHKGQWRGALMFSLIGAWANGWTINRDAGDLRRNRAHYDVTVMCSYHIDFESCPEWIIGSFTSVVYQDVQMTVGAVNRGKYCWKVNSKFQWNTHMISCAQFYCSYIITSPWIFAIHLLIFFRIVSLALGALICNELILTNMGEINK